MSGGIGFQKALPDFSRSQLLRLTLTSDTGQPGWLEKTS